ncbi:PST family polysaccharide transporter [Herbihabitans rhizosphaerae]|uniref:PST family polysaccharide transporter n=1 Tax=Herbihabitans rhizosphaerae TaxID=1872711 RepID=A0A4Q7KV72_9PSEU|nr:lipopolysaccharide biosynthesis protein [Herbihabitans rhizosphaerae]RZS40908.1 PST family polysaccharide transporter [Herbihabitans rhizosphaerae]
MSAPAIGRKVGRGALWSLLNNVVLRLGVLVSGIVLARLLSPADYGVFAVALVAMTLLQAFNELGVSLALVRWERDVRTFAGTAMTIAIATSTVLYAAVWFGAPAFCEAMGSPAAVEVMRVLCLAVLFDGIAVVPAAILNREFLQGRRFLADVLSFATSTSVTITLAATGSGPMSFAIGTICGNIASVTCYLLLCPVKVRPAWNRDIARELIHFGLPLAGASLLTLSVSNVDKLGIGALTDEVTLGLYLMAFNQSSLPLMVFSEAARRVSLAGFSRLLDDRERLENSLARGVALLMAATVPVCVLLACYAEPMLAVVYGEKWTPAAVALQVLAALGLLRVILFVGYDLLVALDGNRILLALQALWLVCTVPALIAGTLLDGIRGASIGQLAISGCIVLPAFAIVLRRRGVRLGATVRACVRPAVGGLLIIASAIGVREFVDGSFAQLAIGGLVALAVYAPVVLPMRALLPGRSQAEVTP